MTFWRKESWWLTVVADVAAVLVVVLPGTARLVQAVAGAAAGIISAAYVHGSSAPAAAQAPAAGPAPAPSSAQPTLTASQVADVFASAASSLRGGA